MVEFQVCGLSKNERLFGLALSKVIHIFPRFFLPSPIQLGREFPWAVRASGPPYQLQVDLQQTNPINSGSNRPDRSSRRRVFFFDAFFVLLFPGEEIDRKTDWKKDHKITPKIWEFWCFTRFFGGDGRVSPCNKMPFDVRFLILLADSSDQAAHLPPNKIVGTEWSSESNELLLKGNYISIYI